MENQQYDKIGFFDAFLGLVTQPAETTEILLSRKHPQFVLRLALTIFITIFGPSAFYVWKYGSAVYTPSNLYAMMLTVFFYLLCFVFFVGIYFSIVGIECTLGHLVACSVYSLTPLIAVFVLIYVFNYASTGNLSFAHLLIQASTTEQDRFLKIIPYALIIAQLNILVVICYTMKFLGDMYLSTAMMFTLFSVIPLAISAFVAIQLTEMAMPGSKANIAGLFTFLASIWRFG